MNVHINILRWSGNFRTILGKDGWLFLTAEIQDELDATHPQVGDEDAARIRLHRFGLLTSGSLRIEFHCRHQPRLTQRTNSANKVGRGRSLPVRRQAVATARPTLPFSRR